MLRQGFQWTVSHCTRQISNSFSNNNSSSSNSNSNSSYSSSNRYERWNLLSRVKVLPDSGSGTLQ